MYIPRLYQTAAINALEVYWTNGGGNALISMPTGTGKSLVIAAYILGVMARYPKFRPVVLTHRQELIEQDLKHLLALQPDAPVGINSAALGRRDTDSQILFASIASVYRNPRALGFRDLVIIDEAHLVPLHSGSMYRQLFAVLREISPALRICGLSGTCFRMDQGRLDEGENKIFDEIVYDYSIGQAIKDGWLAPLISIATETRIDVGNVHIRGGEFIESELQEAVDTPLIVRGAVDELVELGKERKSWLAFCVGVTHAGHVCKELRDRGITAEVVTGKTPRDERERILADFKAGLIQALVNVNVLTTGFDCPNVDLLALLRPTLSTGLYVQMLGRGTRKAPGKVDCLVLDFARNVYRHGPVDLIDATAIQSKDKVAVKVDTVRAWECPECERLNPLSTDTCIECGYERPKRSPKPRHATQADAMPVLSGEQKWMRVTDCRLYVHHKRNDPDAPPSLRATYTCGLGAYSEYLSFERRGYPRGMAEKWWYALGGTSPVPATVQEAIDRCEEIDRPYELTVFRNGDFWNIDNRRVMRTDGTMIEMDRHYNLWTIG
jgi:DNA repair protein RadD